MNRPRSSKAPGPIGERFGVLALIADDENRALLARVLSDERLSVAAELQEGLAMASADPPDVAFVDVMLGGGAGLAMIHHIKAVAPNAAVYALASTSSLEAGANAVALGGAGLLMLPLGGDEILSALAEVRERRAEVSRRGELERSAVFHARAGGWMARLAELGDTTDRRRAAEVVAEVMCEATGASAAAVYLSGPESRVELSLADTGGAIPNAPRFATEADVMAYARRERLLVVPLSLRALSAGFLLLRLPDSAGPLSVGGAPRGMSALSPPAGFDGLLRLLSAQASMGLGWLSERERSNEGGAIKDPTSSAYSFAYYADVAGREIAKAKRHARRFAIATILLNAPPEGREEELTGDATLSPAELADDLLRTVRDADVLARVDEHEFHLLLSETDGVGAHACRRRILARMAARNERRASRGLLVGVATYPHDGQDLARLLRTARRRAEASDRSVIQKLPANLTALGDVLLAVDRAVTDRPAAPGDLAAARALSLPLPDAVALVKTVMADALRSGDTFVAFVDHPRGSLGAAVRASIGAARDDVTIQALDAAGLADSLGIEVLSIVGQHGSYGLIGRHEDGVFRGVHAADPLLADVLIDRLSRAAAPRAAS